MKSFGTISLVLILGFIGVDAFDTCKPACSPQDVCESGICKRPVIPLGGACSNGGAMRRRKRSIDETCADPERVECVNDVCSCKDGYQPGGVGNKQCVPDCGKLGMILNQELQACYKFVPKALIPWDEMQAHCRTLHPEAHLVEIQTAQKQQYVDVLRANKPVYAGGRRVKGGGLSDFVWTYSKVDFSQSFTRWRKTALGNPDGLTDITKPQTPSDCLVLGRDGGWLDTSCRRHGNNFICELYLNVKTAPMGGQCGGSIVCAPDNTQCVGGVCKCRPLFRDVGGRCDRNVYNNLGEDCTSSSECTTTNAYCDPLGYCACRPGRRSNWSLKTCS